MYIIRSLFTVLLFSLSIQGFTQTLTKVNRDVLNHAKAAPGHLKGKPEKLVNYLTQVAQTDREKVEVISYWITEHVDYDLDAYQRRIRRGSTWEDALKNGKAVCSGYAKLFTHLLSFSGIESFFVPGYAKNNLSGEISSIEDPNHAWNIVYIDGEYYPFDLTWAAGGLQMIRGVQRYVPLLKTKYLFANKEEFSKEHFPVSAIWQLTQQPKEFTSFRDSEVGNPGTSHGTTIDYVKEIEEYKQLSEWERFVYEKRDLFALNGDEHSFAKALYYAGYNIVFEEEDREHYEVASTYFAESRDRFKKLKVEIELVMGSEAAQREISRRLGEAN